ncbi:MAG TPA: EutN/CcmL family microcompartment protein [Blastocatellia bacterium]|nr:EutN/CcmL family microcompartment protein [Blastocatellia bacterium]
MFGSLNGFALPRIFRDCVVASLRERLVENRMVLARIIGTVVATRKDERLHGRKLLVARLVDVDGKDEKGHVVAVDTVGAGFREIVLIVQGSSARMAFGCKECPVDAAVVGIVDTVEVNEAAR